MKKPKFIILALACMIACVLVSFGLIACSDIIKPSDGHTHNYQWVDNGDGTHKQHCSVSGCGEPDKRLGSHRYENGVCVCGKNEPTVQHTHNYQ